MSGDGTQPAEGTTPENGPQGGADTKPTTQGTPPPWGSDEEFSAEKAWKLIQNLRADKDKATARVREFEDKDKSDLQRATDKLSETEKRAAEAEHASLRLEVALDKAPEGMSVAQVRKLAKRLSGKDRAELEADAAELFAEFKPTQETNSGSGTGRPKERGRPGASNASEPDEMDPAKLAAKVPRMY